MKNHELLLSAKEQDLYFYFVIVEGNEDLLKQEISLKFPRLKLSYSRSTLITYKLAKGDSIDFGKERILFALSFGMALGKICKKEEVVPQLNQVLFSVPKTQFPKIDAKNVFLNPWNLDFDLHSLTNNLYLPPQKISSKHSILEVVMGHENQYLIGFKIINRELYFINNHSQKILEVPSRAYYKIEDIFNLFHKKLSSSLFYPGEVVLDFGSAPGGASYFFLQNEQRVYGIDSGEMNPNCLTHSHFTHLKMPLERITLEHFPRVRQVHWIALDINLDPRQVLRELSSLLSKRLTDVAHPSTLRGLFFTVKMTRKFDPFSPREGVDFLVDHLFKMGFKNVFPIHTPSHKKELLIAAINFDLAQ